jgi:NTE family protein
VTTRALVLGSGGITGAGWELGLLAGLAARGLDLSGADLTVGTSAGALAAAQLASGTPLQDLYLAQCAPVGAPVSATMSRGLLLRYALAVLLPGPAARARVRLGRIARASPALDEAVRAAVIGAWLPSHDWPARRLLITAVDADTGECAAFEAGGGASLIEAVSASCAVPGVWPPVTIGGRRWMDGGMRSAANADLAAGHDRVVVLAPIWRGLGAMPAALRQCQDLARGGSAVMLVTPGPGALAAIGRNMLDAARRGPAARAGFAEAAGVLAEVAAVWSGERRASTAGCGEG